MKMNENLAKLQPYTVKTTEHDIKRCHANESHNTILPIEILTKNTFSNLNYYPEKIYETLTVSAAKFYKTNPNFTVPVNGSDEGIDIIIRTLCNPQDKVIILKPTFGMYKQYATAIGTSIFEFLNENFLLDTEQFISFCHNQKPKIVLIPNPLAPSGGIIKTEDIIKIIETSPNTFFVIDEAYIEFSSQKSAIDLIERHPNLLVTRTVSKFFGLAGIRLGFIFCSIKEHIQKIKAPYNVNAITCQIGINLFQNLDKKIISSRYTQNITDRLQTSLWLRSFKEVEQIYESHANYVFAKLNCNARTFAEMLMHRHKIQIKAFDGEFEKFCRVSNGVIA